VEKEGDSNHIFGAGGLSHIHSGHWSVSGDMRGIGKGTSWRGVAGELKEESVECGNKLVVIPANTPRGWVSVTKTQQLVAIAESIKSTLRRVLPGTNGEL